MKLEMPKAIPAFFRRFHSLLFFLLVSGGLFVAILIIMTTIGKSSDPSIATDQVNAAFDETTIQRIKENTEVMSSPGRRPSPFVE